MFNAKDYPIHAADLSRFNGRDIWPQIDQMQDQWFAPVTMVHIKCTSYTAKGGFVVDPLCDYHAEQAERRDLATGFYHFIDSRVDAVSQADAFASELKRRAWQARPFIDFEPIEERKDGKLFRYSTPSPELCALVVKRLVSAHGIYPAVYCGQSYLDEWPDGAKAFLATLPVILAAYRGTLTANGAPTLPPLMPRTVTDFDGYQFTMGPPDPGLRLDRSLFLPTMCADSLADATSTPSPALLNYAGGDMFNTIRDCLDKEDLARRLPDE